MMDMTQYEIERLVEEYFGCGLTRDEEADLRTVLLHTPYHSDAIDECRLAMGLEAIVRKPCVQKRNRMLRLPYIRVAAAVAVAVCTGLALLLHPAGQPESDNVCIAFVNGKEITDPNAARQLVEHEQHESMALLESIRQDIMSTQENYNKIINDIQNSTNL